METTAITAAVTAGIKINASSKYKFKFFNKLFNQQSTTKKELITMERPLNKTKNYKLKAISAKQNKLASTALTLCIVTALAAIMASDASAAETTGQAVDIPFVSNLKETVKQLMTGAGSFVIDAMILAGGGWATARTSTPAPIILAILSVFIFEICVKLITQ